MMIPRFYLVAITLQPDWAIWDSVKHQWDMGLTILLAIPFMSDTAVNYFYSLLNEEGHAIGRWHFVLANLIGGIVRAYLFLWLLPR